MTFDIRYDSLNVSHLLNQYPKYNIKCKRIRWMRDMYNNTIRNNLKDSTFLEPRLWNSNLNVHNFMWRLCKEILRRVSYQSLKEIHEQTEYLII